MPKLAATVPAPIKVLSTGAGKTTPFILPLLVETKKIVVIISPLNALEEDQVNFNSL